MTPEEDSDDEVCFAEEGFVTEDMLTLQEKTFNLQSLLLAGATEIDILSEIVHKVTQPSAATSGC